MLVPDAQQPPALANQDNDRGDNRDPCPEDGEYFDRPDAATMEEAISGMEAQKLCGFHDLHSLLGHLPVPNVKASQAKTHKDMFKLEGCFILSMT